MGETVGRLSLSELGVLCYGRFARTILQSLSREAGPDAVKSRGAGPAARGNRQRERFWFFEADAKP